MPCITEQIQDCGGICRDRRRLWPFDLTMLEIGASHEFWKDIHMGPDGAAHAYAAWEAGKSRLLMPIHWACSTLRARLAAADQAPVGDCQGQELPLFVPEPGVPTEAAALQSDWWQPQRSARDKAEDRLSRAASPLLSAASCMGNVNLRFSVELVGFLRNCHLHRLMLVLLQRQNRVGPEVHCAGLAAQLVFVEIDDLFLGVRSQECRGHHRVARNVHAHIP